jgi:hypothetical protein
MPERHVCTQRYALNADFYTHRKKTEQRTTGTRTVVFLLCRKNSERKNIVIDSQFKAVYPILQHLIGWGLYVFPQEMKSSKQYYTER